MKLIVCGTGSSGNTYLLTSETETLVLDCGMPFLEVKKALDFNISNICGAVVSHCHFDHAKYIHEYETAGIPVWKPYEDENLRQSTCLGGFRIHSFDVVHNVPCVGYLVEHKDLGKMLYATDTAYLKYRFKDLDTILIEANWGSKYVHKEEAKYMHTLQHHMSIDTCLDAIRANTNVRLSHIILCHLSNGNSHAEAFLEAAKAIAPPGCTVNIAESGMEIDLDEIPF